MDLNEKSSDYGSKPESIEPTNQPTVVIPAPLPDSEIHAAIEHARVLRAEATRDAWIAFVRFLKNIPGSVGTWLRSGVTAHNTP